VVLNHGELPVRARSGGELAERVRRAEDYAVLGAEVVVELHTESHAAKPSTRAWAITRRADRAHRRHKNREQRADRRHADLIDRPYQAEERGWLPMPADPIHPCPGRRATQDTNVVGALATTGPPCDRGRWRTKVRYGEQVEHRPNMPNARRMPSGFPWSA
jgi:hypothetical protein